MQNLAESSAVEPPDSIGRRPVLEAFSLANHWMKFERLSHGLEARVTIKMSARE